MLTNAMFSGFPLGAAFGGFLAAWMIPQWGWRSVLVLGGVTPLLLVVLMVLLLPESVRYMVAKVQPVERIRAVLSRISSSAQQAQAFFLTETKASVAGQSGLGVVLSPAYRMGSLMLWLAYFMGLVIFYALIALTAATIYAIGQTVGSVGLLVLVVFVAGTFMNTAQSSMPALAAGFYPTQGSATGVAWMLGRFGCIAGSFLVAELARRHFDFAATFMVIAIPGVIAMLALLAKQHFHPETASEHNAGRTEVLGH